MTTELAKLGAAHEKLGLGHIHEFLDWCHSGRGEGKPRLGLVEFREDKPGVPCPYVGTTGQALMSEGHTLPEPLGGGPESNVVTCSGCKGRVGWRGATHQWIEEPTEAGFYPLTVSIDTLLFEYAGIDEKKLEADRREALAALRRDLGDTTP